MQQDLIFVVDDDDELRSLLEDVLEADGFRVLAFSSPHGALREIRDGRVHDEIKNGSLPIIVSDNLMPGGMSGMDFLIDVRREFPSIPFVLMTAFGGDEIFRQSRELGASSFLKKPFSLTEFSEHISRARADLKSKVSRIERGL